MASGIYVIRCKSTGKVYVGSSKDIEVRWYHHKQQLKRGTHHSVKLQRAWDKYGEDDFEFEIVEEVIDGLLTVYEQIYINHYNSPVDGYNILKVAGMARGRSVHQERSTQYKSENIANHSQSNPQNKIAKRKGLGQGRPGGNPDFGKKYKIPRAHDEALDTLLAFKITRSLKEELDGIPDKNEFCRNAIIKAIQEMKKQKGAD